MRRHAAPPVILQNDAPGHRARLMLHGFQAQLDVLRAGMLDDIRDRLSRNAAFLLTLRDAGVPVTATDMPKADGPVLGILAAVAQSEREAIAARTKAALAQAKLRGRKLGNPNGAGAIKHLGNAHAIEGATRQADAYARKVAPVIQQITGMRTNSPTAIAREMNARNVPTARGGTWTAQGITNIINRLNVLPKAA